MLLRTWHSFQKSAKDKWREELLELPDPAERERKLEQLEAGKLFRGAKFHDLRHLHASVLILHEGKTPLEVAARLGHTNPSFTMNVYAHLFDRQKKSSPVSILTYLHHNGGPSERNWQ